MPIYEYSCQACGHQFEALIRKDVTPACPSCDSRELERLISLPSVQSEGTKGLAMRSAKKRDAEHAKDRMHDRLHYERSHDRHG